MLANIKADNVAIKVFKSLHGFAIGAEIDVVNFGGWHDLKSLEIHYHFFTSCLVVVVKSVFSGFCTGTIGA